MSRAALLGLVVVMAAAACGEARTTIRPSQSLLEVEFTPRDSPNNPGRDRRANRGTNLLEHSCWLG